MRMQWTLMLAMLALLPGLSRADEDWAASVTRALPNMKLETGEREIDYCKKNPGMWLKWCNPQVPKTVDSYLSWENLNESGKGGHPDAPDTLLHQAILKNPTGWENLRANLFMIMWSNAAHPSVLVFITNVMPSVKANVAMRLPLPYEASKDQVNLIRDSIADWANMELGIQRYDNLPIGPEGIRMRLLERVNGMRGKLWLPPLGSLPPPLPDRQH